MKINEIWNLLSNLSLIHWIFSILSIIFSGGLIYFWRYLKSQWRFGKNLKRKVYFLKTSENQDLEIQKESLELIKLFNLEGIKNISKKLTILQTLENNAVFIIGYEEDYDFKKLFKEVKNKKIPIIIFAEQGGIQNKDHWNTFNDYIYCDVANTNSRLAIILLNILKIV